MSGDLYNGPCEAGCVHFHGGEVKHHKDCGYYPESLTKLNADRIEELEAKLAKAEVVNGLLTLITILNNPQDERFPEAVDLAELFATTLAELKGETQ